MNDLSIKANAISDKATQGPQGRDKGSDNVSALAGLAISFQDMIHKAGARIEDGFSALVGRANTSSGIERVEAPRRADDYGRDRDNDTRDRFDYSSRDTDNGNDRSTTGRADRDDNYGRDPGGEHRDDRGDAGGPERGESQASSDDGERDTEKADAPENQDQDDESQASSDDGGENETADSSNSDDETQTADGEAAGQDGSAQSSATAGTSETATSEAMASALLSLIPGGEGIGVDGQASEQGKVSSAEGIATATQAIAAATGETTSKETPGATIVSGGQQNNHQAQAGAQAKTVANENSALIKGTQTNTPLSTVETQASSIAKALGDGNRAQVTVSVTNESQTLTSKPNATLSTNSVISANSSSQSSSGQQTSANSHSGGNQGQTAQAQAQQAQAANAQNQGVRNTGAQAGGGAKGLAQAQAVSSISSAGSTHAGGGEGVTQAGGVTGTQQTQQSQGQNAAEQANNTQKPASTGRSAIEQISVKIAKAIQAGSDKITIQLRPANMGRVEVKLEMIQDNRVSVLVVADNRETLELLQKDSRELQRALQDAGLNAETGDLNYNLRGEENQAQKDDGPSSRPLSGEEDIVELEEMIMEEAVIASDGRVLANGRIDVRA